MWVHTTMEKSFADFKKTQKIATLRKKQQAKPVTESQENTLLAFASQFVRTKNPPPGK